MSHIAIKVEGLSKRYRIGAQQRQYRTLRASLNDKALAPFRAAGHLLKRNGNGHGPGNYEKSLIDASSSGTGFSSVNSNTIWALKDVSFEVEQGEVLGIIGRNGAGKSTLLKILSRITEPTDGYADITGRLASLLEVGTGFHPELTGRENIFLNGSILGMRRAEIHRKFDEIVAFSEVEKFIDTPVKHYSSGMYVRLAFAVAAHLDPEILLVDEVLAVGDVAFQKKCLGKMGDVAKEGRTVLFVSHNMGAVQRLCRRSILLEHGRLTTNGVTNEVVSKYLSENIGHVAINEWIDISTLNRFGSGQVRFQSFKCNVPSIESRTEISPYDCLDVSVKLLSDASRSVHSLAVTLYDQYGVKLVNADTLELGQPIKLERGLNSVTIRIDELYLTPGVYVLGLWAADPIAGLFDHVEAAGRIEVHQVARNGFGETPVANGLVPCSFSVVMPNEPENIPAIN